MKVEKWFQHSFLKIHTMIIKPIINSLTFPIRIIFIIVYITTFLKYMFHYFASYV